MKGMKCIPMAVLLFMAILASCTNDDVKGTDKRSDYREITNHTVKKEGRVELTIEAVYKKDKLTILLHNGGTKEVHFGTSYILEKQKNGKWYQTMFKKEQDFTAIAMIIAPGDTHEQIVTLKIPKGKYRVLKQLSPLEDEEIIIGDGFTVK